MTRLHPRSATLTWAAPAPPNGIITNYTACLCPSSVCSNITGLNSSVIPNSSSLPDDVLKHLNSDHNGNSSSVQSSGTKAWQNKSPLEAGRHRNDGSDLINPNSTSDNPRATSLSAGPEVFLETEHSLTAGCFSSAWDPSSLSRLATVPGNSTNYTFLDLQPYQVYTSQVRTGKQPFWAGWVLKVRVGVGVAAGY